MLQKGWLLLLTTFMLVIVIQGRQISFKEENGVKQALYLSPKFVLGAGSVVGKFYQNLDFPRGHIALKEFNAEIVDEDGNSVPLHETYLHHWVMLRYYALTENNGTRELNTISARNSGTCQNESLGQYFGLGSETRRTRTHIPDPYGIQVGNPADIPDRYEERWMLNVHAIDTRGVIDSMGCTQCRCNLYNVTVEQPNYLGGLSCCVDQGQCKLKEGFKSIKRNLYLRYSVKWIDWVDSVVPVKVYILDATDTRNKIGVRSQTGCKVEYDVLPCDVSRPSGNKCIDSKKTNIVMRKGGHLIYGVAHQHAGAVGSSLYGEDGRKLCSSTAKYGKGKGAGNEAGYVVGMTTCYPRAGSVKIYDGETLSLEANYNNNQTISGVMGLFYLLIAEQPRN